MVYRVIITYHFYELRYLLLECTKGQVSWGWHVNESMQKSQKSVVLVDPALSFKIWSVNKIFNLDFFVLAQNKKEKENLRYTSARGREIKEKSLKIILKNVLRGTPYNAVKISSVTVPQNRSFFFSANSFSCQLSF